MAAIILKIPVILNDEEIEVVGLYHPGYNSSLLVKYGDDEDQFIIKYAIKDGEKIKLSQDEKDDLEEDALDAAREEFSKTEINYIPDDDEEDDEDLSIVSEDDLFEDE